MDRDVPENRRINSEFDEKFDKIDHDDSFDFEDNVDYDEDNLSMEQLQELFLATQEIQKGVLVKRPKFVTKKLKYFWNEKRVQDLTIARRFAMEKFKMDKKSSFGHHFYKYWKKLNPGIEVKKSQVLARHNFQIRFEKKMLNQKVDKVIKHWENMCNDYRVNEENIEVIDESLNIKTELDLIKEEDKSQQFPSALKMEYNPDIQSRDYNRDEDVLSYLRDEQANSRSQHNITWTPEVIADLISARREARRRKRIWEEWAIREFGGVGIAYNKPNITFSKVDDMFKEEWAKKRPNLANLSIWTLVSYARKFDTLKKQLIQKHNQISRIGDRRRKDFVESYAYSPNEIFSSEKPKVAVVYFENSMVPKYDLEEIKNLHLNQELENLIVSRQLAKIRQETDKVLNLNHLWRQEWSKLVPENPVHSGEILNQRLYLIENRPGIRQQLKQAVMRSTKVPEISAGSGNFITDEATEEETLKIKPRHFVFPEAENEGLNIFCYVDVPLPKGQKERWYVELERDVYNKDQLLLPMLEDGRGPADEEEEVIKFPPKAYKNLDPVNNDIDISPTQSDNFQCHSCPQLYTNMNNLKYHQELHHEPASTN